MLDLRTYGLKIYYSTIALGHVDQRNGDELLYKELHFTIDNFRAFAHSLVTAARETLTVDVLLFSNKGKTHKIPAVPWQLLRDNLTNGTFRWSFLKDSRTKQLVNGDIWLETQARQNPDVINQFIKGNRFNVYAVSAFMDRVADFKEKLAVLFTVTGGQGNLRWPELGSIWYSNTITGGYRNVFIKDGTVVYVTQYYKGYAISGNIKVIYRYLLQEVGELYVQYVWLVLPFIQQIQAVTKPKTPFTAYVWPASGGSSGWKQTSKKIRHVLQRESAAALGQRIGIAALREVTIAISRRFLRKPFASDEEGQKEKEVADEQAGYLSYVAGLIYARTIMEQAGAVVGKRQQFREYSEDQHRFLGFIVIRKEAVTPFTLKRKRAPFKSKAEQGRLKRLQRLRLADPGQAFKEMMGSGTATLRQA